MSAIALIVFLQLNVRYHASRSTFTSREMTSKYISLAEILKVSEPTPENLRFITLCFQETKEMSTPSTGLNLKYSELINQYPEIKSQECIFNYQVINTEFCLSANIHFLSLGTRPILLNFNQDKIDIACIVRTLMVNRLYQILGSLNLIEIVALSKNNSIKQHTVYTSEVERKISEKLPGILARIKNKSEANSEAEEGRLRIEEQRRLIQYVAEIEEVEI